MIRLIRPPYKTDSICPPINLMVLAAAIEPWHRVSICDFVVPYIHDEMSLDAVGMQRAARHVLEDPAPVLGFTSMCSSYAAALRIAQECKRQDPGRFILFGGPHAGFVALETMQAFDFVDAVVAGEGEATLRELLDAMRDGLPFTGIAGLTVRDGERIVQNPARTIPGDLDHLPVPAFHLIEDVDRYYEKRAERFIEIEAGRGCPFNCTFCSTSLFFARKYRVKSSERLVQEMRWLKRHWKIDSFGLIHDNLTSSKEKVRSLCQYIMESGEPFRWHCSSRTDTIDRPLMEVMKEAGCQGIFFGVETGNDQMQKVMGKRLKIHRIPETFQHLQDLDIDATASFIIGFPEETLEMLDDTLTMALGLRLGGVRDVQLHPLSALPGTRVLAEHEARLQFHPHLLTFHDITSVIDITDVEMGWIERYPRIFSNFYAVPPLHYPLERVYQIRGCYFYLIHYRPYTLLCLLRMAGLEHAEIVNRLCRRLPPQFDRWTPGELLSALAAVVQDLEHESRSFIEDVLEYEGAITASASFTDGSNGWISYKGEAPAAYVETAPGPRLKPVRVLALNHDVPLALRGMKAGSFALPPRRAQQLAVVFEWDSRRIRTLEVDPLTALIAARAEGGEALEAVLSDLAGQNPHLESDEDRRTWPALVRAHLLRAGLVIDPGASGTETAPGIGAGGRRTPIEGTSDASEIAGRRGSDAVAGAAVALDATHL